MLRYIFKRTLKIIHLINTVFFVFSSVYLFTFAMHWAGRSWWFIAFLSAHSASLIFLLIALYLFAVYKGLARSQKTTAEHPLTTGFYYMLFYSMTPVCSAFLMSVAMAGAYRPANPLFLIAITSAGATVLVWIVIDPVAGVLEMFLPSSRRYRCERIAKSEKKRKSREKEKQEFFTELQHQEQKNNLHWQHILRPEIRELSRLISEGQIEDEMTKAKIVQIGVRAFRKGGIECMKHLHSMVEQTCKQPLGPKFHYISIFWDGIGNWRSRWLEMESET